MTLSCHRRSLNWSWRLISWKDSVHLTPNESKFTSHHFSGQAHYLGRTSTTHTIPRARRRAPASPYPPVFRGWEDLSFLQITTILHIYNVYFPSYIHIYCNNTNFQGSVQLQMKNTFWNFVNQVLFEINGPSSSVEIFLCHR